MKINSVFGFALLFWVTGCTSVRTSSLHCTSISREKQELICSDLNRMLVSDGFTASNASEVPWGMAWSNSLFSPLWKGHADFQVMEYMDSTGMNIDVLYYKGGVSANKALVDAIVTCVQRDTPTTAFKIKAKTEFLPAFLGE